MRDGNSTENANAVPGVNVESDELIMMPADAGLVSIRIPNTSEISVLFIIEWGCEVGGEKKLV